MGLDMYLEKRTYIGANFDHRGVEGEINLTYRDGEEQKPFNIKWNRVSYITERVGYWRKANAIHNWFIQICGDGVDDCQDIRVTIENLKDLLDVVQRVLDQPKLAEDLLPTTSGFFFGSIEYDEWYYNDLKDTKKIIEDVLLEEENAVYVDYYYRASW